MTRMSVAVAILLPLALWARAAHGKARKKFRSECKRKGGKVD